MQKSDLKTNPKDYDKYQDTLPSSEMLYLLRFLGIYHLLQTTV